MPVRCTLGVDIGTSSSKGVLVDDQGAVIATRVVEHQVDRPRPGWVEMDARIWWDEFTQLSQALMADANDGPGDIEVAAIGVSGMGPCVLLADDADEPVRPAILYGVDTRAMPQVERMATQLGADAVTRVGGSALTSQAAGPKIVWVQEEEPDAYARASRLYMPASWLVRHLTGAYVLDHQSASQVSPLYEVDTENWHDQWWDRFAPHIQRPALAWAGEVVGGVTTEAARATGIRPGTPVVCGTIDAWAEAVSVGAHEMGDLMLMYGSTMFLIATGKETLRTPSMWTTVGAFPGTRNLAGGLATSGALTAWLKDLTHADYTTLLLEAADSGVGARGLLMLPYLAGERTPILDPDARGVIAGLTLSHGRGDLYRAALEATAMGVRHNVATMRAAGADIRRIVAVGGGTLGELWPQIVSDVTGLPQQVPLVTVGAAYGDAFLAAVATAEGVPPMITDWNPVARTLQPDPLAACAYDAQYERYLGLYAATRDLVHELADVQVTQAYARAKGVAS